MRSVSELLRASFLKLSLKKATFMWYAILLSIFQILSLTVSQVLTTLKSDPSEMFLFFIASMVIQYCIALFFGLMILHTIVSLQETKFAESYRFAVMNFIRGFKVSLISSFFIFIALFFSLGISILILAFDPLLGVPLLLVAICFNIYFVIRFAYTLYIAVLENKGSMDAIDYAKRYTEGHTVSIMWRLLCISFPFFVLGFITAYLNQLNSNMLFSSEVLIVVTAPFGLLIAIFNFEIYKDLKNMFENKSSSNDQEVVA